MTATFLATALWTIAFLVGVGFFVYQIQEKLRLLLIARRDDVRDYSLKTFSKRLVSTIIFAFGQKKFFRDERLGGITHVIIFWGFIVLSIQVKTMFMRGWFPDFQVPGFSASAGIGGPYGYAKDLFEVGVLIAVLLGLLRWLVLRPERLFGFLPAETKHRAKTHWEAVVILVFIATIMVTGLLYDASRMVMLGMDEEVQLEKLYQPISAWISTYLFNVAEWTGSLSWWLHNLVILVFLNLLPQSKHFHIITAIPNVFLGKIEPKGKLPKRDFSGENPLFGRSQIDHFTWKQRLDMFSCTECGRCSSVCPATATKKPLAPRQFLLDLQGTLYRLQKGVTGKTTSEVIIGEAKAISDEVVWGCVECRACEEACPVNIEYVDKIVDIRQHLVQEASRFPRELSRAFKGMETQANPWGISSHERDSWAEGLDVPRIKDTPNAEYLYYVGCGGSFDANNKKASQAFVKILKQARVSFAILGKDEVCNGDSARRLGNEYLFQTMAENLVNLLTSHNVKKILVNCPHCFNTLSNEYPDFGGNWEVIPAAVFVNKLIAEGKLKLNGSADERIVYHDSCYYGRFNDVYNEPRNLIKTSTGSSALEMERSRHQSMCCGAGGGRFWMEEQKDQRVNVLRTEQAMQTDPRVIATSCPFCRIMIGSGVNEKGLADTVRVTDVMELVASQIQSRA